MPFMEKELNWENLQEEQGKFALGYILVKEIQNQMLLKSLSEPLHLAVIVNIDLNGKLEIGACNPRLPIEFDTLTDDEKITRLLRANVSENDIIGVLSKSTL
jgi:hypothetical protein